MNINQLIATTALIVATLGIALAAYGLRYEPLPGGNLANPTLVWDRWEREVCQVSLVKDYPVYCSRTKPMEMR